MSKLLLDEKPLLIIPSLAQKIGLNEAIVLQQLHYWIETSGHEIEGESWIYATYEQFQSQFPWWSAKTIQRTLTSLKEFGLIKINNFNKKKYDKTNWYTIDYKKLDQMEEKNDVSVHMDRSNCPDGEDKMTSSRSGQNDQTNTIDKTTTENNIYTSGHQEQKKDMPNQNIIDLYNTICKSLPKVKVKTKNRDKALNARLKVFNTLDTYETLFKKAEASDFLSGKNKKWTHCNFDWLINEANMAKVLEGNYDNKDQPAENQTVPENGDQEAQMRLQNTYDYLKYAGFKKEDPDD
jgi:hypothetical protein